MPAFLTALHSRPLSWLLKNSLLFKTNTEPRYDDVLKCRCVLKAFASLQLFTKILDSKSVSCTAEGPFEKPNDVPSAQSPRDVEKVILSTMHADGDLARVISASGGTRAGTGSDPATGDVVLLPSNSSTSALVADNLKEDQLNNESKAGAQPLWFSHAISVAANLPLVVCCLFE